MPNRDIHVRPVTVKDVVALMRLARTSVALDSAQSCTQTSALNYSARLSGWLLPARGIYTLLAHDQHQQVIGQYRVKNAHDYHPIAQIIATAPHVETHSSTYQNGNNSSDDTLWMHLFDAMTRDAGKHGAHILLAEIDESGPLFETLRRCNFSVYSRQDIWRLAPEQILPAATTTPAEVSLQTPADALDIQNLCGHVLPSMIQQITPLPCSEAGFIYRADDRLLSYIALSEGKQGLYLLPFMHEDLSVREAMSILAGALCRLDATTRLPVYVCVRRYQYWLEDALRRLNFELHAQQAVMVRHITAGVRHVGFKTIKHPAIKTVAPVRNQRHNGMPVMQPSAQPFDVEAVRITGQPNIWNDA